MVLEAAGVQPKDGTIFSVSSFALLLGFQLISLYKKLIISEPIMSIYFSLVERNFYKHTMQVYNKETL